MNSFCSLESVALGWEWIEIEQYIRILEIAPATRNYSYSNLYPYISV